MYINIYFKFMLKDWLNGEDIGFFSEFSNMLDYNNKNISRRHVLAVFGWISLLPLAGLWFSMVKRTQYREVQKISRILLEDIPQGYSYHSEYLIYRQREAFEIYSTKCTHLGCRLRMSDDRMLVCPCHGSVFDPESGAAIKGPAEKSMEKLSFIAKDDYINIFLK
jgi:nitrite reductase/ring-hydroxylating ferredoxin subunit